MNIPKPQSDEHGILRFPKNKLIEWMAETKVDNSYNAIFIKASKEGWMEDYYQLLMLVGYSVSGAPIPSFYKEIAYELYSDNDISEQEATIRALQAELAELKALIGDFIKKTEHYVFTD